MKKVSGIYVGILMLALSAITQAQTPKPQKTSGPVVTKTTTPATYLPCLAKPVTITDGVLKIGDQFNPGSVLWSPNHLFHLVLQTEDGNLALWDNTKLDGEYKHQLWISNTAGQGVTCGVFATNGKVSLLDVNKKVVWVPSIQWSPPDKPIALILQNDGSLILKTQKGQTLSIYDNVAAKTPKPPSYLGDTSRLVWKIGELLIPGTRIYSPDLKYVLVFDKTGLWIGKGDTNDVTVPQYISKQFQNANKCYFQNLDGNIVVYTDASQQQAVWNLKTDGLHGTSVHISTEGLVSMINDTDPNGPIPVWTSHQGFIKGNPYINSLSPGDKLLPGGHPLYSNNGKYILALETDGNLVLTNSANGQVLWNSHTNGSAGDGTSHAKRREPGAVWGIRCLVEFPKFRPSE